MLNVTKKNDMKLSEKQMFLPFKNLFFIEKDVLGHAIIL